MTSRPLPAPRRVALVVALACALVAGPAAAQAPRADEDSGRELKQFAAGALALDATVAGGFGLFVLAGSGESARALGLKLGGSLMMLAAPAMLGMAICRVGNASPVYEGDCESPLVRAYVGFPVGLAAGATTYFLFELGYLFSTAPGFDTSHKPAWITPTAAVLGIVMGTTAATAISLSGWQANKRRRAQVGPAASLTLPPGTDRGGRAARLWPWPPGQARDFSPPVLTLALPPLQF